MNVLWLRRLVARLSTRKTKLNPRPVPVRCAEGNVALEQVFLLLLWQSPDSIIATMHHIYSFIYHRRYIILTIYKVAKYITCPSFCATILRYGSCWLIRSCHIAPSFKVHDCKSSMLNIISK
jgi:hypothetical protein